MARPGPIREPADRSCGQRRLWMAGQDAGKTAGLRGLMDKVVHVSEVAIVAAAGVLVILSILVAAGILYAIFIGRIDDAVHSVGSIDELQAGVEKVFAGVLLLLLGLELLKCL